MGASCFCQLKRHHLDCLVLDKARFPLSRPCAGWMSPEAVRYNCRLFPKIRDFNCLSLAQRRCMGADPGRSPICGCFRINPG